MKLMFWITTASCVSLVHDWKFSNVCKSREVLFHRYEISILCRTLLPEFWIYRVREMIEFTLAFAGFQVAGQ